VLALTQSVSGTEGAHFYYPDGFNHTLRLIDLEAEKQASLDVFYRSGYDQGYEKGFGDAEEKFKSEGYDGPALDKEKVQTYMRQFPQWVSQQQMSSSIWKCDSEVRIDHPFPEEPTVFAFWASHNCDNYSMLLTVVLGNEAMNKLTGYYGASLTGNGCTTATSFDNSVACEFKLEAKTNFGMLFMRGFTPVFYLTEWETKKTWASTFSFW